MNIKDSDIDLVSLMDGSREYTEDDVREFFRDEEHRMEYMAVLRARQALKRSETPAPDVDAAWEEFVETHTEKSTPVPNRIEPTIPLHSEEDMEVTGQSSWRRSIGYVLAALGGAAAMFLGFVFFWHPKGDVANDNLLTVLEYDESPQHLTMLIDGKKEKTLQRLDSISFYGSKGYPTSSVSAKEKGGLRTLKTPRGMELKVILPDGSEVWLNAESSLEFPTAFTDKRHVALVGEAYFKVARDEGRPFTVSTDKMNVRVLGTEFNFRHYATERTEVALVKGSVEVLDPDNTSTKIVLHPGEAANVGNDGDIRVHPVNTYAVNQWTKGFFYFQDKTLATVLQEIGRWYNMGIVFENKEKLREKIHFSALRKETLQQTLDKLNRLMDTEIVIVGNKIVIR